MRVLVFVAACCLSASAFGQSQAELKRQITALKATQKAEYETVLRDLKGSRDYASGLWTDLEKAQTQLNEVGKERDGWKAYGEDRNEKWLSAEKRVAEEKVKKQRWVMMFSGLATLVGLFIFIKFFTPIGRFMP